MYKVGDLLECKKACQFPFDTSDTYFKVSYMEMNFRKGKSYTITYVLDRTDEVAYKINNIWFCVHPTYRKEYMKNLVDYFTTIKETRKIKLNKLKDKWII